MTRPVISESDLQAHVDGRLPEADRAAVEAFLADSPAEAARIAAYCRQNAALHECFDPVLSEPVPAFEARTRARRRGWRHAAVAGWVVLGIAAGWLARGAWQPDAGGRGTIARSAAIAHVVYSPEVRHPVEVGADQEAHLVAWLSKRLGAPLRVPQLGNHGYALVGGRLLPAEYGPAAQFMYQDAKGLRLTLYVRASRDDAGETAFRYAQERNISVFYWIDGKLGYALSGDVDKAELLRVATAVYRQLNP